MYEIHFVIVKSTLRTKERFYAEQLHPSLFNRDACHLDRVFIYYLFQCNALIFPRKVSLLILLHNKQLSEVYRYFDEHAYLGR